MGAKQTAAAVQDDRVMVTRALRVEIAAPIGMSWDDFGGMLRDRRAVMHRLLNAGTAHLWSSQYRDEQPQALEAIKRELASYREWCAAQAAKGKDPAQREALLRRSKMVLSSSITDAVAQKCFQNLQRWNKDKQQKRVPSAKKGAPIMIRDRGWKLVEGERGIAIDMRLVGATPGNHRPGMVRAALRPTSGKHHAVLKRMIAGGAKCGSCMLVYDEGARRVDGSKGKWYAILSYADELPARAALDPKRALIVHRGMHNFLYALAPDGRTRELKGGRFLETRRRLNARMAAAKNIRAFERGAGAKGHGTSRRYATHGQLDGKLAAVTKTFCQQAAAWAARQARDLGCGQIFIEEYGGQEQSEARAERRFLDHFPYYRLKESIAWACKREGIALREYDACYVSQTCPACGNADSRQHNVRTNVFHCMACEFERAADWVAAYNAGAVAGADLTEVKRRLEQQKKVAAMLKNGSPGGIKKVVVE